MRKEVPACSALAMLFLILVYAGIIYAANSAADSWPMFHHDLSHTGVSGSATPSTNQTLWKFNTGGQMDSPTVAGGVVYVGSLDGNIYALTNSAQESNDLSAAIFAAVIVVIFSLIVVFIIIRKRSR